MDHDQLSKLRPHVGVAHVQTLLCPNEGCRLVATSVAEHDDFEFARCLTCHVCNKSWYICVECSRSQKTYSNNRLLQRHARVVHVKRERNRAFPQDPRREIQQDLQVPVDVAMESCVDSEMLLEGEDAVDEDKSDSGIFSLEHCTETTRKFFWNEKVESGVKSMILHSVFHTQSMEDNITLDDLSLFVSLCSLTNEMSRGMRKRLAKVMRLVNKKYSTGGKREEASDYLDCKLPVTDKQFREVFVKGRDAMIPNLPRPAVETMKEHAYVSVRQCIQDLLGHGIPYQKLEEYRGDTIEKLWQCKAAQSILSRAREVHGQFDGDKVVVLFLTEWSDDFEPNVVKSNRGSVWSKTISISPTQSGQKTSANTYPIGIGPKGVCHEEVEERFSIELSKLKKRDGCLCYSKSHGCVVQVYAELLVTLQDQPERRSSNYIMAGNSNYTARWKYSIPLKKLRDVIPSCDTCFRELKQGRDRKFCERCTNWEMSGLQPLLAFDPPPGFPKSMIPEDGKLQPLILSYKLLIAAVEQAHEKVVSGDWTINAATSYLVVHGLSHQAIKEVIDNADRCRVFRNVEEEKNDHPAEYALLEEDKRKHPNLYLPWRNPSVWTRGQDLDQTIDAIMHLLFLGCQKTIATATHSFITMKGKGESFIKYMDGVLESVQRLNLAWCKALPYKKGNFVGWVSENLLAFSRLCRWCYGRLPEIAADTVVVELNLQDRPRWKKDTCVSWLRLRGLDTSGNAEDVKKRVESFMTLPDGVPPLLSIPKISDLSNVHLSLSVLIAATMTKYVGPGDCERLLIHIKLFLKYFETFDSKIERVKEKSAWISTYNLPSLLNLPETMKRYGPLRNLWEGGYLGEGMLVYVKPEAIYGMRKNWQTALLTRIHDSKAIEQLEAVLEGRENETDTMEQSYNHRRYKSSVDVVNDFSSGRPLSAVMTEEGTIGCKLAGGRMVVLESDRNTAKCVYGLAYFEWSLSDGGLGMVISSQIRSNIMLLPILNQEGKGGRDKIYTAIDSDWRELQMDGSFRLPRNNV